MTFPLRTLSHALSRCICLTRPAAFAILSFAAVLICTPKARAAAPDASPTPDVVVLSNGDTLHGKFVSATAGKVVFHSDPLGDVSLTWDKIKELHTSQKFGVIHHPVRLRGKRAAGQIPTGTLDCPTRRLPFILTTAHPSLRFPSRMPNTSWTRRPWTNRSTTSRISSLAGMVRNRERNPGDRDAESVHFLGIGWPGSYNTDSRLA